MFLRCILVHGWLYPRQICLCSLTSHCFRCGVVSKFGTSYHPLVSHRLHGRSHGSRHTQWNPKSLDDARPSCQAHHRWHSQGLFADLGCECIVCKGQDYQSMNSRMRSCSEMFSIIGSRGLSYSTTFSVPHSKKRLDKHTPWVGRKSWHFGSAKTLRLPEVWMWPSTLAALASHKQRQDKECSARTGVLDFYQMFHQMFRGLEDQSGHGSSLVWFVTRKRPPRPPVALRPKPRRLTLKQSGNGSLPSAWTLVAEGHGTGDRTFEFTGLQVPSAWLFSVICCCYTY